MGGSKRSKDKNDVIMAVVGKMVTVANNGYKLLPCRGEIETNKLKETRPLIN